MIKSLLVLFSLLGPVDVANAQNTGGVFPPMVNSESKSMQYRIAIDPDDSNGETAVAHRLHYLHSLNDNFKWVLFGGLRRTQESDFDFDYIHTGLFWDLGRDGQSYRTGVRFDLRLRDSGRPNHVGLLWINQLSLRNNWTARGTLFNSVQFGDRAAGGLVLHTRWQLAKRLDSGRRVGLEMFNYYGSTDDLGSFNSQNHSLGPIYVVPLKSGWSAFSGVLFGISEAAPDTQFRFWISWSRQ